MHQCSAAGLREPSVCAQHHRVHLEQARSSVKAAQRPQVDFPTQAQVNALTHGGPRYGSGSSSLSVGASTKSRRRLSSSSVRPLRSVACSGALAWRRVRRSRAVEPVWRPGAVGVACRAQPTCQNMRLGRPRADYAAGSRYKTTSELHTSVKPRFACLQRGLAR